MDTRPAPPPFPRPIHADGQARTDRPLGKLAVASVLTVVATALLVLGVVLWSTARIDQDAQDRQLRTVAAALARSVQKIPYDQESVTIWDDAILKVKETFDLQWVELNLGVWMYDYFKHDRIYIVDAGGRAVYTMIDGKTVEGAAPRPEAPVPELVAALREAMAAGAMEAYESEEKELPRLVDFTFADERPVLISAMPIVPETENVTQEPGTEYIIVSVRFLDASFLTDLAEQHFLKGVRFSPTGDIASHERSYPLKDRFGTTIGHVVWVPELPGWEILSDVLPVFAAGLAAIAAAIAFLILSLRRSYIELVLSEAHSKHRAVHDALTGLPNRIYFNERLGTALAERAGNPRALALMFLDLDRFKHVNDTLGHPVGDALIQEVARRIAAELRPTDVLARMGGDEFAIIKCEGLARDEIEAFCRNVIGSVSNPVEVLGHQAVVGISVGIAMSPEAGTERSELARKADIALYQAKNGGLGFQFFTEEMSVILEERQEIEAELRRALDGEGELEVVYQPLLSADDLTVTGVEALIRWNHPRLGTVAPPVFIPIAEECGLIDRLGERVLREACRVAGAWDLGTIAVNVSPIQFRHQDFAQRVLAILAETGLAPERLEIEITEGALLDSSGASARILKALRAAGVRVALDDFGTGYSSLSYLIKLEVDRIKIDRSFVQHLGTCPRSGSIVEAIVTMAHAVGVAVTAEGVETPAQRAFLTRIACDTLQGYLFSAPLSALALTEHFATGFSRLTRKDAELSDPIPADPKVA